MFSVLNFLGQSVYFSKIVFMTLKCIYNKKRFSFTEDSQEKKSWTLDIFQINIYNFGVPIYFAKCFDY